MNNGEYEIDKYIKEMENELTALKTAHQRPLGSLDFFKKSLEFSINLDQYSYVQFSITIKIATPTTKPPIVQVGYCVPEKFFEAELNDYNVSNDYETWTFNLTLSSSESVSTTNFKITALSSQPIIDIDWSYI